MRKLPRRFGFALSVALLLASGCKGSGAVEGEVFGECKDGIDNDSDGFVDSEDEHCHYSADVSERTYDQCADSLDNDGDGWVDSNDADCTTSSIAYERGLGTGRCAIGDGEHTERAAASAPSWLGRLRPFHITDAAHRGHVEELEQAAEVIAAIRARRRKCIQNPKQASFVRKFASEHARLMAVLGDDTGATAATMVAGPKYSTAVHPVVDGAPPPPHQKGRRTSSSAISLSSRHRRTRRRS